MKLALSTATFFSKLLTEDSFDRIKSLGIDTCEVFLNTFYEYRPEFCDTLLTRKQGVDVYSVHALTSQFEPELFNAAPRTRADAEYYFDCITATAKRLGARFYTFHGQGRLKRREYTFDYEKLGKRYCELKDRAMQKGINLALENVHWSFFSCPEYYVNLSKYCPGLSTVLDIKQAMQSDIDYRKYLEVMAGTLSNVHICDYDENKQLYAPGKGIFDFKTLFGELKAINYTGAVTIELYSGDYKSFNEIEDSIKYLRDLM